MKGPEATAFRIPLDLNTFVGREGRTGDGRCHGASVARSCLRCGRLADHRHPDGAALFGGAAEARATLVRSSGQVRTFGDVCIGRACGQQVEDFPLARTQRRKPMGSHLSHVQGGVASICQLRMSTWEHMCATITHIGWCPDAAPVRIIGI